MTPTIFEPMNMTTAESLLKEAKRLFDQLGLAFFLRHGTCLGAVRDKAFIEWDDDLDLGSVTGLHGLTEEKVYEAAEFFKNHGYSAEVIDSELHLSVDLKKSGVQMDWTCYRIIDGNIYQWPVVKIPARLHENLKPIEFLGETFHVPNPPEEYLTLKYGPDWMTPKKAGEFEQEVLDLMEESKSSENSENVLQLANQRDNERHTGSIKVLGFDGNPAAGADVSLAATTVLTGLERSKTNEHGYVYFRLPEEACYVVSVSAENRSEILYLEELEPGIDYIYQPDINHSSGRANALVPSNE
ncbi:MAG: LicD family protein [Chloroflexi bacterium]|nr:LicD family protein [Chloroflexota bacterium]